MVNFDGSDDHEIIRFRQGDYVSHLCWSPDGQKLALDLGTQFVNSSGMPLPMADPSTSALFSINSDGSDLKPLRAPGAAWPAWRAGPALDPRLALERAPADGPRRIRLSWPTRDGPCALQSTANPAQPCGWTEIPVTPAVVGDQTSVTLDATAAAQFFRPKLR